MGGIFDDPKELILVGAIAAGVLLLCFMCVCVRWRKRGDGGRNDGGLSGGLLGDAANEFGTTTDLPSSEHARSSWIDSRMSFASQMLARVERAADEREKREERRDMNEGSNRSMASSGGTQGKGGTGRTGQGSARSSGLNAASSSRIAQFKGGHAPDMIPFSALKLLGKIGTGR